MIEDYVRNARLIRVIDGDTLCLDIDLGFRTWMRRRVRLLGVNCPELTGESRDVGKAAMEFVINWFMSRPADFQVRTHLDKTDSFGRVLVEICSGEESLEEALLASGNAAIRRAIRCCSFICRDSRRT